MMDRHKLLNNIVWALVFILLILNVVTIYLLVEQKNELGKVIDSTVQSHVESLDIKDGYTPVKGKDYFDGKDATQEQIDKSVDEWLINNPPQDGVNGQNGNDGKDASPVTKEQIDASVKRHLDVDPGTNARTPIIRCNTDKDRWEVKYGIIDTWQLLSGKVVECVGGEE